jgi:hypothetical protein
MSRPSKCSLSTRLQNKNFCNHFVFSHVFILETGTLTRVRDEYTLWSSSLRNFLHSHYFTIASTQTNGIFCWWPTDNFVVFLSPSKWQDKATKTYGEVEAKLGVFNSILQNSGQLHAPAALPPEDRRLSWPWRQSGRVGGEKNQSLALLGIELRLSSH